VKAEVCSVGYVVEDVIHEHSLIGGAAYGSALNIARLKRGSGLAALFGDSELSRTAWVQAQEEGVDLSSSYAIKDVNLPLNILHHEDRLLGWQDRGLADHYSTFQVNQSAINAYESIHFTSAPPRMIDQVLKHELTPLVVYTPGPKLRQKSGYLNREALQRTHTLFCNEEEWQSLASQLAIEEPEDIFPFGPQAIVITFGERGVFGSERGHERWKVPSIPPTKFVDSTGAGDAFFIGYWLSYLEERRMSLSLQMGALLASLAIAQEGVVLPAVSFSELLSSIEKKGPYAEPET
jgi:nucleoside kinase